MLSRFWIARAQVFDRLNEMSTQGHVPRGVLDEGRIFDLGTFEISDDLHGRAFSTVHGLRNHVGQPFETHPWVYTMNVISPGSDNGKGTTVVGCVTPSTETSVTVTKFAALDGGFVSTESFDFMHSTDGFFARKLASVMSPTDPKSGMTPTCYPLAIAILNTRGCEIERQGAPKRQNKSRARKGKPERPEHYRVNTNEYLVALRAPSTSSSGDTELGSRASPLPHLRRAHERVLPSGNRIWVQSALVNVRREGDLAFVDRRMGYTKV